MVSHFISGQEPPVPIEQKAVWGPRTGMDVSEKR